MKSFVWPNSVFPLLARADVSDLSFHHYKVAEGSSAISSTPQPLGGPASTLQFS